MTETSAGTTGSDASTSDASTGDGDGDGDGDFQCDPTLEGLRETIFTPSCALAGCHASTNPAGGLDLAAADLEAQLIGQPSGTCDGWVRVVPQSPDESLLYNKLAGPPACGALMPTPAGLPTVQTDCVRTWIEGLDDPSCETCGGNACVDVETDADHCGDCATACPDGTLCSAGSCSCFGGEALCESSCVNLDADPQHCGDCGTACGPNKVCWMGVCADSCADLTDCDGGCVDTQTNPNNCGACNNACGGGNACEQGGCGCPGDGVSFAAEVEPVLADRCAGMGCHSFPVAAAGLDLTAGNAYAELVDVPSSQCNMRMRVAPGQPGASYLLDKLQGINLCFGTKMPKTGGSLSPAEIAAISEWICRGAADN